MRGKKRRNYISRQACFLFETGLSGYVVASFFPLIIFILLCFNVLSTVPRENRLADFLYIYICMEIHTCVYIFIHLELLLNFLVPTIVNSDIHFLCVIGSSN